MRAGMLLQLLAASGSAGKEGAAARASLQAYFQPVWLQAGRKTPGLGMEQAVTCGWGRSHKPQHRWCQRRFDPSLPFPLFLPPGRAPVVDVFCGIIPTFLLNSHIPSVPRAFSWSSSTALARLCTPQVSHRTPQERGPTSPSWAGWRMRGAAGAEPPPGDLVWHKVPTFLCPQNWLEG